MDANTHSTQPPSDHPDGHSDELAVLAAALDRLAAQDLDRLPDTVVAEQVLALRRLVDRLEGQWLKVLAAVDARGAAGAEDGVEVGSTAAWLRSRLRMGAGTAASSVRTARALFRGPLVETAAALTTGELPVAHAIVLTSGIRELPDHLTVEAEPLLLEAARRLDPPRLRRAIEHLRLVADPDGADHTTERRHDRRGVWLAPTWEGMVAIDGLLEAEAGQTLLAALEPLARPADAHDGRSGSQRTADALTELARRALEGGRLPQAGGVRPQLAVTVDLDSLVGHPGAVGGDIGGLGPLAPEACRRLACDGAVTRVLVTRHPTHHQCPSDGHDPSHHHDPIGRPTAGAPAGARDAGVDERAVSRTPRVDARPAARDPSRAERPQGLGAHLRAAMARLPLTLGGAPTQPLDVGRATRVVQPAQRTALAVRDGGCVFPDCSRPLAWCEAHHLVHWVDGGLTDLANLVLLCRA
ncbi:MAG TPA: DUF222 domain-containing protein, partial [Actinomycetota bacterium]|nr:DUF222 domain-containing protein [Actinomycetota bacterium]